MTSLLQQWNTCKAMDPELLELGPPAPPRPDLEREERVIQEAVAASAAYIKDWLAQPRPPYDPSEELPKVWWDEINRYERTRK